MVARLAAERMGSDRVVGVDINSGMLAKQREAVADTSELMASLRIQSDGEELTYPQEAYVVLAKR